MLLETFYPEIGGGETQARLLAEGLVDRGFEVLVVTRRSAPDLRREEHLSGIPIHRVGPVGRGRLKKWGLLVTAFAPLVRLRDRYDVLLICGFRILGVPGIVAARLLGKPTVLKADSNGEMSGSFFSDGLSKWHLTPRALPFRVALRARNWLLRKATAYVALSSEIHGELKDHGVRAASVHRIPNCVDNDRFRPIGPEEKKQLRAELGIPMEDAVAVYTGRLVSYKGLPLLLEVWKRLSGMRTGVRLVIVGEGGGAMQNCEAELREFVAANRLDTVMFTGPVENVEQYLQAADLFVFPTEEEAFGIALIEAMACGLPSIATTIGGIPDIASHGQDAWLIEAGDFDQLLEALEMLLSDRELRERLGRAALRTAVHSYARDTVTSRYVELLELVGQA